MHNEQTIGEAKAFLRANFNKGAVCPCCTQYVKLYMYKLYDTSARALILLSKMGDGFHHIKDYAEASTNRPRAAHFAELRFWDFIEKSDEKAEGKKASGYWAITNEGRAFVQGMVDARHKVLIFNNHFYGFVGRKVSIHEALGAKFDYEDLMGVTV